MSTALAVVITVVGTVASISCVVIYVFNGTRELVRKIDVTLKEVVQTQKEIKDVLIKLIDRIEQIPERTTALIK